MDLQNKSDSRVSENMREAAAAVPMLELLADCGVEINQDYDGPQQFSCPLHGDGQDVAKSARYYPDNNRAKCFGCAEFYDPISWVKAFHGLSYPEAVELLCRDYAEIEVDQETKKSTKVDVEGKMILSMLETDARRLWAKMKRPERITISQVLDKLWVTGLSLKAQSDVEGFLNKIRNR